MYGMSEESERRLASTLDICMSYLRMSVIEARMMKAVYEKELNGDQYAVFRECADRHWNKWEHKINKHNKKFKNV